MDAGTPLEPNGWAIECRINGEDPYRDFQPSLGLVEHLEPPLGPGVRFDSMLFEGLDIPVFYDSLLGKLIVWAESRPEAIRRMRRALHELVIAGVQTNIPFHLALLEHPDFVSGDVHTDWMESVFEMPAPQDDDPREEGALIAAALAADLLKAAGGSANGATPAGGKWQRASRQNAVSVKVGAQGARGWRRGTAS